MVVRQKIVSVRSFCLRVFTALLASLLLLEVSASGKQTSLTIFVPEGDDRDYHVLKHAVETQLSDLGVRVSLETVLNTDVVDSRGDVENLLKRQGEVSVGVVIKDNSLLLLCDDGASAEFFERDLPRAERFEDSCDAVASMVRAGIEHLLLTESVDEKGGDTENDEGSPEESSGASTVGPPATAGAWFGIGIESAYVMRTVRTVDLLRHGGYLGLRINLTPYGAISVGAELLQRSRFEKADRSFAYRRIPMRVKLAAHWPIGRLKLGAYASLLVDLTHIDSEEPDEADEPVEDTSQPESPPPPPDDHWDHNWDDHRDDPMDYNDTVVVPIPLSPSFSERKSRVFFGLSPGVSLEVSLLTWLSVYSDAGADFILNSHDYTFDNGTPVYSYRSIQPHLFIGFRFLFYAR